MDTTDPEITFDDQGICNHCRDYDRVTEEQVFTGEIGEKKLDAIVQKIKAAGSNSDYDCIIGISGGVDSSYVAYQTRELGLRPLAIHLDNGWDSELATKNIENLLSKLKIDLFTYVINWDEFRDLQLSFLKASTPDSEIPSDHAIVSSMIHLAWQKNIKHVILGYNTKTESHLPKAWSQGHLDWKYIKSVHAEFGKIPLRTFPHLTYLQKRKFAKSGGFVNLLNYIDYSKNDAISVLENKLGWKYYGGKHYESIYTRFYQGYMLPAKFGFDKRKSHLSSLICSGEMTRAEALDELTRETYPVELQREDRIYVIKKLGLTEAEFEDIMRLPAKSYWDYNSYGKMINGKVFKFFQSLYHTAKKSIG